MQCLHCRFHTPGEVVELREDPTWAAVWEAVKVLEDAAPSIAAELSGEVPVTADDENVADRGNWSQCVFVRDGRTLAPWESPRFQATVAALQRLRDTAAADLPKGSMMLSVLSPGSRLRPHCGPTNHRLRLHLPVYLPSDSSIASAGPPTIRVGNDTRTWELGKVLVLDDSFDHEAANPTDEPRAVLLVDIWHPWLSAAERDKVREDFVFNSSSSTRSYSMPHGRRGGH